MHFKKISNYSAHIQNFNISISICYKSNFSGLQTINICHFALSFCSPLSFSPLPPRCVSPLCLPGAVIPTQRVGVSVLRQRARARWWKTKASSVFTGVVYEPIRVIPRQEAVAPSMSLKMTYFLQSSTLWQFATLLGPGKRAPPSPKKSFFLSFPKET